MIACFLGTSSGVPAPRRNVTGLVLEIESGREFLLFDCGEATQHQLRLTGHKPGRLSRICITHMHGDHVFGLPGLVSSLGMQGRSEALDIHGPAELEVYLRTVFELTSTRLPFPLRFHVATPGEVVDAGRFTLRCAPLEHRVPATAWRVDGKPRATRIDVEKAEALGVPRGPALGRLKAGDTVSTAAGTLVRPEDVCVIDAPGRSFVFATDSRPCAATVELARGADLLVHEATYADAHAHLAATRGHATATEAAGIARDAGVARLVLTHFSPRYGPGTPISLHDLLEEARRVFPATDLANDFLCVEV